MNSLSFHSSLARPLADFVRYKQALNRKYKTEAMALRLLDRYLSEHNVEGWKSIDTALVEDFLASRSRLQPRSYNDLLGVLHRFFRWAVAQRLTQVNPEAGIPRRARTQRIPYILGLTDVRRLLALAHALRDHRRAVGRGLVCETIFALLYGLGLRVGEAVRLTVGDADLARDILFIRHTKFNTNRIVPMGPKLATRFRSYLEQINRRMEQPDVPVFSLTTGRPIHPGTISGVFHRFVPKLQLHLPPGVAAPRLHDLRHSFAVATLLRW
ncbi:MAG: tyrosine-type recombinase/integrase [Terriglobia bacterium]|jgi:site-specific recombinase XerD